MTSYGSLDTKSETNSSSETSSIREDRVWFYPTWVVTEVVGLCVIGLAVAYTKYCGNEFTLEDGTGGNLSWHIVCMTTGLLFLYGNSMMIFRLLASANRFTAKLFHASIHTLSIVLAVLGLYFAIDYHREFHTDPLYTLHSWIGALTLSLFLLQFIVGFTSFLFPGLSENSRKKLVPFHRFIGILLLCMVVMSIVTGISNYSMAVGYEKSDPSKRIWKSPPFNTVGDVFGVSAMFYALGVAIFIWNPSFAWQVVQLPPKQPQK